MSVRFGDARLRAEFYGRSRNLTAVGSDARELCERSGRVRSIGVAAPRVRGRRRATELGVA